MAVELMETVEGNRESLDQVEHKTRTQDKRRHARFKHGVGGRLLIGGDERALHRLTVQPFCKHKVGLACVGIVPTPARQPTDPKNVNSSCTSVAE
jgi:hypothetical protein